MRRVQLKRPRPRLAKERARKTLRRATDILQRLPTEALQSVLGQVFATTLKSPLFLCRSPEFFGKYFGDGSSWVAWFTFLKILFGERLETKEERKLAFDLTRRTDFSGQAFRMAWLVIGRRGGKSLILAIIAIFIACFRDYSKVLKPGESGQVMVIAADRKQARVIFRYVRELISGSEFLSPMVKSETSESITLKNGITIAIHTCSFRSVRGYTIVAALLDEIAFWRDETSRNPDVEVLNAILPGMATVPGAILIGASSPYARRGVLYTYFSRYFGRASNDCLVVQADTRTMNPTVPESFIEAERRKDPSSADAEYGAQFRSDVETFIPRAVIEAAVINGREFLPPREGVRYFCFVDPSGGGQDPFAICIGHEEKGRALIDLLWEEKPPFNPEAVVADIANRIEPYRITSVMGDHYGGDWPASRFRAHGLIYNVADQTKSELYMGLLPLLTTERVDLLDDITSINQLAQLERKSKSGARSSIDHPPRSHDDRANVIAGTAVYLLPRRESWSQSDFHIGNTLTTVNQLQSSEGTAPW